MAKIMIIAEWESAKEGMRLLLAKGNYDNLITTEEGDTPKDIAETSAKEKPDLIVSSADLGGCTIFDIDPGLIPLGWARISGLQYCLPTENPSIQYKLSDRRG